MLVKGWRSLFHVILRRCTRWTLRCSPGIEELPTFRALWIPHSSPKEMISTDNLQLPSDTKRSRKPPFGSLFPIYAVVMYGSRRPYTYESAISAQPVPLNVAGSRIAHHGKPIVRVSMCLSCSTIHASNFFSMDNSSSSVLESVIAAVSSTHRYSCHGQNHTG